MDAIIWEHQLKWSTRYVQKETTERRYINSCYLLTYLLNSNAEYCPALPAIYHNWTGDPPGYYKGHEGAMRVKVDWLIVPTASKQMALFGERIANEALVPHMQLNRTVI